MENLILEAKKIVEQSKIDQQKQIESGRYLVDRLITFDEAKQMILERS